MKQTLYLLAGCLFFFSCHQQKQITTSTPSIKGYWQGVIKDDFRNRKRYISFEDSLCNNSMPDGLDLKYYVNNDTVYLESRPKEKYHQKYQYAIKKLTNDSLVLLASATDDYPADTLHLRRINKKNTLKPTAIYFASSGCFGSCPAMYLQINADRTVAFFGMRFAQKEGGFRGKLSEEEYATVVNLINNLPVDSMKQFYRASYTDAATRGVAIEAGGKLIKSTVYGTSDEPVELTILLYKLLTVYEHIPLQADTTVSVDYFSKHPAAQPLTGLLRFPESK